MQINNNNTNNSNIINEIFKNIYNEIVWININ